MKLSIMILDIFILIISYEVLHRDPRYFYFNKNVVNAASNLYLVLSLLLDINTIFLYTVIYESFSITTIAMPPNKHNRSQRHYPMSTKQTNSSPGEINKERIVGQIQAREIKARRRQDEQTYADHRYRYSPCTLPCFLPPSIQSIGLLCTAQIHNRKKKMQTEAITNFLG